jgi:hypothetical protein
MNLDTWEGMPAGVPGRCPVLILQRVARRVVL